MTYTRANPAAMELAANEVRRCHNALVDEKDGLNLSLRTLSGSWQGTAAQSWQNAQGQWNRSAEETFEILRNLFNALEIATGNFTVTSAQWARRYGA